MCFSSLTAAILDFRLLVTYGDIHISIFEFYDTENIGIAVGITFLSHLEADKYMPGGVYTPRSLRTLLFFRSGDEG